MARSKITIMNQALSASGQPGKEITEASTGPEFALMERHYAEIVGEAFENDTFHFGKDRKTLTTRSTGDFGFNDRWLVEDDVLHLITVLVNGYPTEDWERNGDYIYINASSNVSIEYIRKGSEASWTSTFTNAIAMKLEALLRRSLAEEYEEGVKTDRDADFGLQKAGMQASKQRGPRRGFREGYLIRSRRHGPQRFRRRGEK